MLLFRKSMIDCMGLYIWSMKGDYDINAVLKAIGQLIKTGQIVDFKGLFKYVDRPIFAEKTKIEKRRLYYLCHSPWSMDGFELGRIAGAVKLKDKDIKALIENQRKASLALVKKPRTT